MVKGLYTAYTGMLNQQNRMDVLTNNLANSATVGFKKEGATTQAFDDVLAYHIKDQSNPTNVRHIGSLSLGAKVGENCHRLDSHFATGSDDPHGDLSAICHK